MASPPEYFAPPQVSDASRPSLGFPLGTALLLIIIFTLSGIFSCCYHWEKLRSLRGAYTDADPEANDQEYPTKAVPAYMDLKETQTESVPVIMPGDEIPKFIALPCPCQPMRPEKIIVKVEDTSTTMPPTIPVPL